ncbi:hypothetical protein, partial [Streptomyces sp. NPDC055099]
MRPGDQGGDRHEPDLLVRGEPQRVLDRTRHEHQLAAGLLIEAARAVDHHAAGVHAVAGLRVQAGHRPLDRFGQVLTDPR